MLPHGFNQRPSSETDEVLTPHHGAKVNVYFQPKADGGVVRQQAMFLLARDASVICRRTADLRLRCSPCE